MHRITRNFWLLMLLFSFGGSSCLLIASNRKKPRSVKAGSGPVVPLMDESKRAEHALNRLTFGPRPGDVQKVQALGVDRWIELQLNPQNIPDAGLESRLQPLRTLKMSPREMVENFPPPQLLKAMESGKADLPSDPMKRRLVQAQIENYRARQQNKQAAAAQKNARAMELEGANSPADAAAEKAAGKQDAANQDNGPNPRLSKEDRLAAELHAERMLALPADQRVAEILKMDAAERRALMSPLKPEEREKMLKDLTPQQSETLQALMYPGQVMTAELQQGKILRAVYSERQLEEIMTDFWFNHFNVFINKGADRYLVTSFERDVIRPRLFGKFKDLLLATAQSPAMLFYLDNWQSVGPDSDRVVNGPGKQRGNRPLAMNRDTNRMRNPGRGNPGRMARIQWRNLPLNGEGRGGDLAPAVGANNGNRQFAQQKQRKAQGLNENYAREVMELHTLGVDGGYTQADVTQLARVLTGWTIKQPQRGGDYQFDERLHEPGKKVLLGQTFKEDGEKEGLKALEMLARHPSTAHFISRKLATRFVSDNPPPALVERMAQSYLKSDGDIREVLRTMFRSPEFWSPDAYRAKVKTPFEFVVSAIRATGTDVQNPTPLAQVLNRMGMPLYGMQPPTGYSMKGDAWVNSAALLDRMNFALALGAGKFKGANFNPQAAVNGVTIPADSVLALGLLESTLLSGDVSRQTHQTILQRLTDPQVTQRKLDDGARPPQAGVIAGLILGSPEFQRR